jgi:hypothetical protein
MAVSGGGGGTYPTVQPTLNLDFANSKTVDPRITFVRNSTATYYDGQTTAMAEQNLLLQSQDFSNSAWIANFITKSYTTALDGTNSALLMTGDGTANVHRLYYWNTYPITSQRTYSIYAKAGTNSFLQIYCSNDSNVYANFNLTTGLVGTIGSSVTASNPVYISDGWYRCSMTTSSVSASAIFFNLVSSSTSAIGELNSLATSVYLWGAQLEQRSSVTAYTPTTTAAITNYIPVLMTAPAGVPRLDYNPITGVALGLLIEESRVNLLTYSQSFISHTVVLSAVSGTFVNGETVTASGGGTGKYLLDKSTATLAAIYNGTGTFTGTLTGSTSGATATCGTVTLIWTLTNSTVTAAATIAPDGTQTAFNLVSNTATGLQAIAQTATKAASALVYTSTVHFKANQYTYSWLQISDGAGNGAIVYFNLTTGAISTAVAGVGTAFTALSATTPTSVGNGWYRCNITGTSNTATSLVTQFGSSTNGTSNSVIGNGYNGVYVWGASSEQGSFPTSYIPTVATTITRAADQASMTGTNFSSWYNQSQGSWYAESNPSQSVSAWYILTNQNGVSGRIMYSNGSGIYSYDGTNVGTFISATVADGIYKTACALTPKLNTNTAAGNIPSTNITNGNILASTALYIGSSAGSFILNGHIRKLSYYPVALSSSSLVALTS